MEKAREEIAEQYRWKLEDLFQTDEDWESAKNEFKKDYKAVKDLKGTLSKSAQSMLVALNAVNDMERQLIKLYSYATMKSDQDIRVSKYLNMKQEIAQIANEFSSLASFIDPEILAIPKETIESFLQEEKDLQVYQFYLSDLMRKKAHRRNDAEEALIADTGAMADNPSSVFNVFTNAELPYPIVRLRDDSEVVLNQANFALHRASKNREDRKLVVETFFKTLANFRMTFGTQLYGNLKKDVFYKKARNYSSCLEHALDVNNIPTSVYHKLIENVNQNLPTFHRYLNLRKRLLKVDHLQYYDLYAPLVASVDLSYSVEEAQENILQSLYPLGSTYQKVIQDSFERRWIDMFPNEGKRSGAYSNGSAYDIHPYILMNYKGKYNDMSTLMHELGHTMHSYLSNENQPYPLARYPIFVAEVASTFNEELLNHHLLQSIDSDEVKISILGNFLEGAKGTLFRQTQFSEFELKIHELVEDGKALTGEDFDQIYLDITRKYYGHQQNICQVDEYIKSEWSYVPHFYYHFYVYQYATSFTATQALSEKVIAGDEVIKEKYLNFLSSGGSKYPIDLLKDAGVDMTSNEPFEITIQKMNAVMDEMDRILDANQ